MADEVKNELAQPAPAPGGAAEIKFSVGVDKEHSAVALTIELTGERPMRVRMSYTPQEAASLSMALARAANEVAGPRPKPGPSLLIPRGAGGPILPGFRQGPRR